MLKQFCIVCLISSIVIFLSLLIVLPIRCPVHCTPFILYNADVDVALIVLSEFTLVMCALLSANTSTTYVLLLLYETSNAECAISPYENGVFAKFLRITLTVKVFLLFCSYVLLLSLCLFFLFLSCLRINSLTSSNLDRSNFKFITFALLEFVPAFI